MERSLTAVIILAAGNSSRLGLPKQLIQYDNESLLRGIARKALATRPSEVITVLGFNSDRMRRELDDLPVRVVLNREWSEGIASSVRAGIQAVHPSAQGALISLCDQPAVTSDLLARLISLCSPEKTIAATEYNHTLGVPACFHRSLFQELLQLHGDTGAKRVIAQEPSRVTSFSFPDAATDIDTLEDYRKGHFSKL